MDPHIYRSLVYDRNIYINQWFKFLFFSRLSPIDCVTFRKSNKIIFVLGEDTVITLPKSPMILLSFLYMLPECLCSFVPYSQHL